MQSRCASGFTLVEILVAVLVLAVGILGAGAAQVAALRTRHASALLSDGVALAASLAERMRANSAQMHAPDARNPYLQLQYDAAAGAPPAYPACFAGARCGSAELAAFDMGEAMQALYLGFPGGRLRVCRDAGTRADWACSGGAGAPIVIKLGWLRRQADERWHSTPALTVPVGGAGP